MDQSSGIRAKTRRGRGRGSPFVPPSRRAALRLLAAGVLAGRASLVFAAGGHDAPAPAPAPAAAPPPPVEPRRLPPDVQPPIAGPIAAPAPQPRIRWLADPVTGIALGGYDPLAYFLDGRPERGDPTLQLDWGGTTWWFRNPGNLAAFRKDPEVYAPAFAGRCAFAVANGRPAEGSPLVHLIWHGRLLLFADPTARVAFLTDPDRLYQEALRRWPAIVEDLP